MKRPAFPPGWATLLAAALSAAACAGTGNDFVTDAGGMGGAGGHLDGGPPPHCQVSIATVTTAGNGGLAAGPGATLRVRGDVTGAPAPSFGWRWNVTFADGSRVADTEVNDDPGLIEFPLARPGSYTIDVALTGSLACSGQQTTIVPAAGARLESFRFRFVPPPGGVPAQDQQIQISGGTPLRGKSILLLPGTIVRFDPRDASGMGAVPSYVRVTDQAGNVVSEARTPTAGGTVDLLLVSGNTYDMLVVPSVEVAPILITGKSPAELQATMPLALSPGVAVSGSVTDSRGAPVMGAEVALQAGALPSTLAMTDATGGFTLHASPGTYGATITRASGSGALTATVSATPGLTIAGAGGGPDAGLAPPLALDVQVPQQTDNQLMLQLDAHQPASLGAGAKVVVESSAPILNLATLTFAGVTQGAAVRFRAELDPLVSGSGGLASVTVADLPAAPYRATVFPATPDGLDAITAADIDLSSGVFPPAPQMIALDSKVLLGGTLVPGSQTAGVLITALDIVGDFPIAVAGASTTGGAFSLSVSPERTYRLRAQPTPAQPLARTLFGPVAVGASGATVADQPMKSALLYAGTVVDDALQGVGGTLVQVYCLAVSSDCADPATPLAETVTLSDGTFQLMLPDPGVAP
jgi:hypothetical protein